LTKQAKGEENITSACIDAGGSLLAVSTVAELKLFRLRQRKEESTDALRISKLEIPQAFSKGGAKLVAFSPDAHWLVVVDTDNLVRAFKILAEQTSKYGIRLLSKAVELKRIHRERVKQTLQHGSLGNYDRTIIRIAFSDDSRILVVGDLAGYLDSWVLEGHEDLTQDIDEDAGDARSSSTSSDDDSEDEEKQPVVVLGQHWIRNPAATLLPKLPSAPLILSFRPSEPSSTPPSTVNDNTAVHPTRHNPHPHSHDLPVGEDRLLALTSEHHIYEFQILKGSLSDWSRRNPTQTLPADFRENRDRAMGCVWDINEVRQRVWLYGSGWLWMFDLAKDFPSPAENVNKDARPRLQDAETREITNRKKRKLEDLQSDAGRDDGSPDQNIRNRDTGAGSKVRASELTTGIGWKIRRTVGPELAESQWTALDAPSSPDSEDDDDEDGLVGDWSTLTASRRGPGGEIGTVAESGNSRPDDDAAVDAAEGHMTKGLDTASRKRKTKRGEGPVCWSTYKYRPILGIVPIGMMTEEEEDKEDDGSEESAPGQGRDGNDGRLLGIEVAIVERPMWDVDLPPRYYGDQEWDK